MLEMIWVTCLYMIASYLNSYLAAPLCLEDG